MLYDTCARSSMVGGCENRTRPRGPMGRVEMNCSLVEEGDDNRDVEALDYKA
jgi:hypothetical protein